MLKEMHKNDEFDISLEKDNNDSGTVYRISKITTNNKYKQKAFAKFCYIPNHKDEVNGKFHEILLFKENMITENDVEAIFKYIVNLFANKRVFDLNSCIGEIKSTFGNSLGFSKIEIINKIGEFLFIKMMFKKGINLTHCFDTYDTRLLDFNITNDENSLKIISTTKNLKLITLKFDPYNFNIDSTYYIISMLEESDNGLNLKEIISDVLEIPEIDHDFREYSLNLQYEIEDELFVNETRVDSEKIDYKLYVPEKLKEKVPFLHLLSDFKSWGEVREIQVKLDFGDIENVDLTLVKEILTLDYEKYNQHSN